MINIFKLNTLKFFWTIKNNKIKLATVIIFNTALLLLFFFGLKNKETLGIDYTTLFIIYILIWLIMSAFTKMSDLITNENKEGTLEILFTSPYGFIKILFTNILMNLVLCIILLLILFFINNLITGVLNNVNILQIIPILIIGMFSLYGIGLIIAGITLLTKDIDVILLVIRLIIAYLIMTFDSIFIPFTVAKNMIVQIVTYGSIEFNMMLNEFFYLFLNSIFYFLIGIIVFKFIEILALKKSYLGN